MGYNEPMNQPRRRTRKGTLIQLDRPLRTQVKESASVTSQQHQVSSEEVDRGSVPLTPASLNDKKASIRGSCECMNRKRKRSPSQDSDAGSADDGSCRSHPAVRSISDRPGGILEKYIDNRLQPIEDSVQALDDRHVKLRGYYEAHKKLLEQQHALRNSNAQSLQSTTNRLANRMTKVEGIVESQKATVQELEDLNEKSSLFDQARKEMLSNAAMLKTGEGEMEKRVVNVETAMTEKMAQSQGELQTLINTTEKQNVQNVATLRSDFISTINGVDDKTAKRIEKLEARIPPLVESNRSANTLISNTNQRLDNLTKDLEQIVLIQQKVTSLEQAQKEDSENFQTSLVALEQSQIDLKTLTTKNRERADTNLDALRTLAEDSCVKVTEQHERLKSVETTQKGIPETVEQTQEEVKAVRTQNENLKDQVTDHQALLDTTLPQQATAISDLLARVQTLENDEVRLDLCSRLKELEDKSASQEKELGIVKETLSKIQTKADQQVAEMETKCDQKVLEMQTKQEQLMLKMQTDFEKRLLELKQQQDLDREQRAKGTAEVYHTRERDAANISELRSSVEAVKQDQAAHVAECHQAMDPLSDTIIVAIQAESRRTRRACTGVIDTAVQTLKDRLDAVESTVKALESAPSNCTELAARVKALLLDMEIFEQKHQTREVGLANLRRRIKNSDALANSLNEAFEKLANLTTALDGTASKNELASVREQLKQLETQFSATIMAKLTHMDQICHGRKEGIQADIQEVRAVQDRFVSGLTRRATPAAYPSPPLSSPLFHRQQRQQAQQQHQAQPQQQQLQAQQLHQARQLQHAQQQQHAHTPMQSPLQPGFGVAVPRQSASQAAPVFPGFAPPRAPHPRGNI